MFPVRVLLMLLLFTLFHLSPSVAHGVPDGAIGGDGYELTYRMTPVLPRADSSIVLELEARDGEGRMLQIIDVSARAGDNSTESIHLTLESASSHGQRATFFPPNPGVWHIHVSVHERELTTFDVLVYPPRDYRVELEMFRDQVLLAGVPVTLRFTVVADATAELALPPTDLTVVLELWEGSPPRLVERERVGATLTEAGDALVVSYNFAKPGQYTLFVESATLGLNMGDQPAMHVFVVALETGTFDIATAQRTPFLDGFSSLICLVTSVLVARRWKK